MVYKVDSVFIAVTVLVMLIPCVSLYLVNRVLRERNKSQQSIIERLINRDPMIHANVEQAPSKPDRTVYAAWGNQMINIDEDERQ